MILNFVTYLSRFAKDYCTCLICSAAPISLSCHYNANLQNRSLDNITCMVSSYPQVLIYWNGIEQTSLDDVVQEGIYVSTPTQSLRNIQLSSGTLAQLAVNVTAEYPPSISCNISTSDRSIRYKCLNATKPATLIVAIPAIGEYTSSRNIQVIADVRMHVWSTSSFSNGQCYKG